jgi:iron-sulfur cluster assembly protein
MIQITPQAAEKLATLLREKETPQYGLRVFVSGGGCAGLQYGMALDEKARPGDQVFETNGIKVFVDPFSLHYLDGASIDYVDALMGGGFTIENPNAIASCACGHSFRTEGDHQVESTCSH